MTNMDITFVTFLFSLVLSFRCACSVETIIVRTRLGEIIGHGNMHTFNGKNYSTNRFLGIPYAKAPVGTLRFKRPEPLDNFSLPFEATKFGSACPQNNNNRNLGVTSRNENCLFLNIYVPSGRSDNIKGYAVMIFIHGGGFLRGTSSSFMGEVFCGFSNVILVTINYRLGVFGFANTGDEKARGNMGLWDQ